MRTITSRLLLPVGAALAAALVAAPATLALAGNSSFSRDIRVPVPSGAHEVHLADRWSSSAPDPSPASSPGHRRGAESGHPEDSPRSRVASSRLADDHGGRRGEAGSGTAEPGDDSGDSSGGSGHDHGSDDGSGHHGSDDGSGHDGGDGGGSGRRGGRG